MHWWKSRHGYIIGREDGSRRTIRQHRWIVERHLGRALTELEIVHHVNGVKDDNRIENLQVMSREEHCAEHGLPESFRPYIATGPERLRRWVANGGSWRREPIREYKLNCGGCGAEVIRSPGDYHRLVKNGRQASCSTKCRGLIRWPK